MKVLQIGLVLLMGSLGATALVAATQQEAPSAAEAARRARSQKKDQPKSKQVWTNDNIPTTPGAVSVVGKASEQAPEGAAETSAENENNPKPEAGAEGKPASAAPGAEADQKKAQEQAAADELAKAKAHLASLRTDLDLLQREYTLEQQTYYGKPDFASDKEGKAKLDALAQQVEAKRQEVQEAEQQVADLEQKTQPEEKTEAPPSPPSS